MATKIRPELSMKNKYWIDKHRHYELKHFCLQYRTWKRVYSDLVDLSISISNLDNIPGGNVVSDLTAKNAIRKTYYADRIKMVEKAAKESDEDLYEYILKGVTEGYSYDYLKTVMGIPCSRDTYYDRYRRFFWILDQLRD